MNSIAAISQYFSQLSGTFSTGLLNRESTCVLLFKRSPRSAASMRVLARVLQMPVEFDEIRFRSISSSSEGCYITTGKALKSSVTLKHTM